MTQYNVGVAYAQVPIGDRAGNLQKAIDSFTQALRIFTADIVPADCRFTARGLARQPTGQRSPAARISRALDATCPWGTKQ